MADALDYKCLFIVYCLLFIEFSGLHITWHCSALHGMIHGRCMDSILVSERLIFLAHMVGQ